MKKLILAISILSTFAPIHTNTKVKAMETVHTFQSVAVYKNGFITDKDGEIFKKDFMNISNGSICIVTYDNKNTVTRYDDEPISLKVIGNISDFDVKY
jgi:hypothetical protein